MPKSVLYPALLAGTLLAASALAAASPSGEGGALPGPQPIATGLSGGMLTDYDDLAEGFKGTELHHNGVTYREVNGIGGVFPDGDTFTPDDVGDELIIEDAGYLFDDFPDFGSTPNVLTFGTTFMPGPNLSLGALVQVTLALDTPATAASFEAIYYENGPWGGIQLHLDAYRNGVLVGSDVATLSDLGDRDNLTTRTFSVGGATFDTLHFHATYDGQPSAPRVMIDNLRVTPEDALFADGFDGAAPLLADYDDLTEGFKGQSMHYQGATYRDVNGIGGVFPDGDTFTPDDVGDELVIEDAGYLFNDFPDFGSTPNVLTFGTTFMPGPNLSLGALVQVTLDLDAPASAASFEAIYYENGPWGGIQLHLDALDGGTVVASDVVTLSDLGDRDNLTTRTFSVKAARFDSLHFYATYDGQPSAPRVMIDNLMLTP
ncbi:MAG: hypothetical protein J0H15_07610 [Xanthomonadales bacterium]|nr:hypothetical protein [Xanthomonadales bacterium]